MMLNLMEEKSQLELMTERIYKSDKSGEINIFEIIKKLFVLNHL